MAAFFTSDEKRRTDAREGGFLLCMGHGAPLHYQQIYFSHSRHQTLEKHGNEKK